MTTVKLKDLATTWLWLIAIDYGDGVVRLTYKAGSKFLETVIHLN